MQVELLPGMTNVVRFPVERRARPTMALLREIAPDVRQVLNLADAFGMEPPVPELRERVDAATAEYIANQSPPPGPERERLLAELLEPVAVRAVAACRAAHDASLAAGDAHEVLRRARLAGHFWVDGLQQQAEALTAHLAELLLIAHAQSEEAEGVARAVDLACRGEVWAPRDYHAEADELFGFARAAG